jgi:hypothetical protein
MLEGHTGLSGRPGKCPTCAAEFIIPDFDLRSGSVGAPLNPGAAAEEPTSVHAYAAAGALAPEIVLNSSGVQVIRCPRCASESPVDGNNCKTCGLPFTLQGVGPAPVPRRRDAYAVASLVMGLLGLPCAVLILPQILAVAFGAVAYRRIAKSAPTQTGRGMATTGIVCGLFSLMCTVAAFFIRLSR